MPMSTDVVGAEVGITGLTGGSIPQISLFTRDNGVSDIEKSAPVSVISSVTGIGRFIKNLNTAISSVSVQSSSLDNHSIKITIQYRITNTGFNCCCALSRRSCLSTKNKTNIL